MHSGNGSRRGRRYLGYAAGRLRDAPIGSPDDAADDDGLMDLTLLVEEGAWERAGEELRRVDPQRYLALLKIVQDIVSIHRDPLGAKVEREREVLYVADDEN